MEQDRMEDTGRDRNLTRRQSLRLVRLVEHSLAIRALQPHANA